MRELGVPLNAHRLFVDDSVSFSQLTETWWSYCGTLFIAAAVLYLPIVFVLKKLFKNQPPRNLKAWRAFHNLGFCIFSTVGAVELFPTMVNTITTSSSFYETVCGGYYQHRVESFWIVMFVISKLFELVETFYFILEQKPIPFIHWYHHIMTFIFSTFALYLQDTSILYYSWMNFAVHAVMYFYYFLASVTNSRPSWAPLVTIIQILQMFVGTAVIAETFVCEPQHK